MGHEVHSLRLVTHVNVDPPALELAPIKIVAVQVRMCRDPSLDRAFKFQSYVRPAADSAAPRDSFGGAAKLRLLRFVHVSP